MDACRELGNELHAAPGELYKGLPNPRRQEAQLVRVALGKGRVHGTLDALGRDVQGVNRDVLRRGELVQEQGNRRELMPVGAPKRQNAHVVIGFDLAEKVPLQGFPEHVISPEVRRMHQAMIGQVWHLLVDVLSEVC